jgi:molybdopterin-guanine dinucleotide biosynthesis protein A
VSPDRANVGGLLLTGGASRRFGSPKAELIVGGERLADRGARLLLEVCDGVLEVGPGYSSLPCVLEEPPGSGPLAALAAGGTELVQRGTAAEQVLVLAVDLPFVTRALLEYLRDHPTLDSVVPRLDGVPQPLCARYADDARLMATVLVREGARAMKALFGVTSVTWIDEREWTRVASPDALADVDTPDDARRSGIELPG